MRLVFPHKDTPYFLDKDCTWDFLNKTYDKHHTSIDIVRDSIQYYLYNDIATELEYTEFLKREQLIDDIKELLK